MIYVTKAYLPKKEKYQAYVNRIFESGWLTNRGSLLEQLEQRLSRYLGVKHLICVANGSLALQVAYKALELKREVITSPFSFVGTIGTLTWEGLKPVFADISRNCFNMDPNNIEPLITKKTSAIVPVHVFGNPCQVELIQAIADQYDLKVIYDAAHAFGTEYTDQNGHTQSVLNYGDISTISFHATKIFHTIEGGAVITNDDTLARKIRLLINFGINDESTIKSIGTNAKMNEFEAAMGLCLLDEIDVIKAKRKHIWQIYQEELKGMLQFQNWNPQSHNNHAYAPVLFDSEDELLRLKTKFNENEIFPRRYFYPSLDTLNYLNTETTQFCPISREVASRILCLPIYPELKNKEQLKTINVLKKFL